MVDRISEERRSWNMSRIRGKNTSPELRLRSLLHGAGYRFRLHDPKLPGRPDIVLRKHRTVIFVHGCYWHRHSGCTNATTPGTRTEFWQAKFDGTVKRDRLKARELRALGWRVITVWECELEKSPQGVLENIDRELGRTSCNTVNEVQPMTINHIHVGDYVVDHMDGSIRRIILIDNDGSDHQDDSVYLADGGVMPRGECTDILLESEVTG